MISIIIPFLDEEKNIEPLYSQLKQVLSKLNSNYELVFVNDGSTDDTGSILSKLKEKDNHVRVITHRKKMGKGQSLSDGIKISKGDIIFFMDGDLQDDPADIKKFLEKINEGAEFVNGVRSRRKDNIVIKIYSKIFNLFLKTFLSSPFTDINCGFKAMRRGVLNDVILYSNNFRFLPLVANLKGFKVAEVRVNNRDRLYGKSKFGIKKIFIGIFDTLTAYFIYKFAEKPLHFFGMLGSVVFSIGFLLGLYLTIERLFFNELLYRRPALLLAILLIILGAQIIMTGFLGELIVYFEKKKS